MLSGGCVDRLIAIRAGTTNITDDDKAFTA